MTQKWINQGDHVKVITGNDKGRVGKVILRAKDRIIVEGVNVRKRHAPAQGQQQQKEGGNIIEMERPIHISNVALTDADGNKIKLKVKTDGQKKDLVYDKGGKETVFRTLRK
ncbi:MAG: 50S ribosomal protein L24 [Chlamydiales bacterium]|nr:50S ribosomal protein L24 [Chlamydiales bacterium]